MKINEIVENYTVLSKTSPSFRNSKAYSILDEYYPKVQTAIERYKTGARIYRGVQNYENANIVFTHRTEERKAANTSNYVNLLVSNLPNWKDYPPRNRSTICSGNKNYADEYGRGNAFVVLPFEGAIIGICPGPDFFDSFDTSDSQVFYAVPAINDFLEQIYFRLTRKELPETKDEFFAALKEIDNLLDRNQVQEILDSVNKDFPSISARVFSKMPRDVFLGLFKKDKNWFYKDLIKLLDPVTNKFKAVNIANFPSTQNEVWTDAPCLMVNQQLLDSYLTSKVGRSTSDSDKRS